LNINLDHSEQHIAYHVEL